VKSECAALRPTGVDAWDPDADKMRTLAFRVLGNGVLELCVEGRVLPGNLGLIDDVVFVGIQTKTKAQINEKMRELSYEEECGYKYW
jgi:hypothetical protein